jgi:hypothetical protein
LRGMRKYLPSGSLRDERKLREGGAEDDLWIRRNNTKS